MASLDSASGGAIDISASQRPLATLLTAATVTSAAALTVLAIWLARSNAIEINGMEMNVVFSVQKMLLGTPLYASPAAPPYDIAQYSPLYYLCVAFLARLSGFGGSDVAGVALVARMFSVAVALLLAVLCYRFMRRNLGASQGTSFIATVFIIAGTSPGYFVARPDGLAAAFTIASFHLILRSRDLADPPAGWPLIGAVLCTVGAVMTKQNGLLSVIVVLIFLVALRAWRSLSIAGGTLLACALAIWLSAAELGPAWRANIVDGVDNGLTPRAALLFAYGPFFYWFAPLLAVSLAALAGFMRPSAPRTEKFLAIALSGSLAVSTLTALKRGAAENYFNEFIIVGTFAVLYAFITTSSGETRREFTYQRLASVVAIYLIVFLSARTGHQIYVGYLYHRSDPQTRLSSQRPPADYVRRWLEPGRSAIGFAVGLSNMLPGRMLVAQQEVASMAHTRGLIDYSRFRSDVETGRVQFVVVRRGERPQPLLGANFDEFEPVRQFAYYTVYAHRAGKPR